MKGLNITGQTFCRLTAVSFSHINNKNLRVWNFKCSCGNTRSIPYASVKSGNTKSCGCLHRELAQKARTKHGKCDTPAYYSYMSMKQRCNNPNEKRYPSYGGRGIKVCARWAGKDGFVNFLKDMGERPEGTTLDRMDNDGDYSPDNCRYADSFTQNNNTSRNRPLTYNGVTMNMSSWARKLGIASNTLLKRLNKWDFEDCFVPKKEVRNPESQST